MNSKSLLTLVFFNLFLLFVHSQIDQKSKILSEIRTEGLINSQAMDILQELSDVYGQRLTGSREYYSAANWISDKMKSLGLEKVHFENFCDDCRGWSMKSFNVEMTFPNYMHINAHPLAMSRSSNGVIEAEVIHIPGFGDMQSVRQKYTGKLKGKVVLTGRAPKMTSLTKGVLNRYSNEELEKMEDKLTPKRKQTPLPDLFKSWETSDKSDLEFLNFVEEEGGVAVVISRSMPLGVLHPDGTYYYKKGDYKPLPYFTIMAEHFGRIIRMLERDVTPKVRFNLDVEFYNERENNVNIIGEIGGEDAQLKFETILIGAHFDSWHAGTGATDNGASSIVLIEALRILKEIGYKPKRTLKLGLWGGEEQAFLGSVSFADRHYGSIHELPNKASKKVSVYLNLDNGAGAIRGIYLQGNERARPIFEKIFKDIDNLTNGTITIENTLSTDHETFDHYNIPAFQFIQDDLTYGTVNHHTQLDVLEYVPEEDLMKNAVILAYTIYCLSESNSMVPRKK